MAFAAPKYGNTNESRPENFKLKTPDGAKGEVETHLIGRIVPPIKSLAEAGKWAQYHGQHFGYSGSDPRNPDKVKMRPFSCIKKEDFRTKMVTVSCSACETIEQKKQELELREAEYRASKMSEPDVRDHLQPLNEWIKRHNCDRKWHMGFVDQEGKIGVLQISHTLKKTLDKEIDSYRTKRGTCPILDGVLWDLTRMGKFPVQDNVKPLMMPVVLDGEEFMTMKKLPFTDNEEIKINEIVPDLVTSTLRYLNGQQIDLIVNSGGDPDEIDRIWAMAQTARERSARPLGAPAASPRPVAVAATAPKTAPVTTQAPPVLDKREAVSATEDDEEAAAMAALAAARAKKAAAAVLVPKVEAPPETVRGPGEEDVAALSDEDFYSKFGVK